MLAAFLAGGLVAVFQPWKGTLGPIETGNLLRERLQTKDQFDCREPSGTPLAGEPDWDYVCVDVTNRNRQGYLVKTSGTRITEIQPTTR